MKEAVVLIADTHINSTKSICLPGFRRDDGDSHGPSLTQTWLRQTWLQCQKEIEELTNKYHRTVILVGDVMEVNGKHLTSQVISTNPADARKHASEIFDAFLKKDDDLFVIRGTEAHTGTSGWAEEELADDLKAIKDSSTGAYSWWHLRAEFGGIKFDIGHHASMGGLPWTYGNAAMRLAVETMSDYVDWEEPCPDIVARAHNHRFADSGLTYKTRAIFLPAWTFSTAYLHRLGRSNNKPHIGSIVILCEDGYYDVIPMLYKPKREPVWRKQPTK